MINNNIERKKLTMFWRILIVLNVFSLMDSLIFILDLKMYYFIICIITFIMLIIYLFTKKKIFGTVLFILEFIKMIYLVNPNILSCEEGSGCAIVFLWFILFIPIAILHLILGIIIIKKIYREVNV